MKTWRIWAICLLITGACIMMIQVNLTLRKSLSMQNTVDSLSRSRDSIVVLMFMDTYHTDSIQYVLIHDLYEQLNEQRR